MKIAVVGGGIIGLCTAWALQEQGHDIVLLEQGELPNFGNASTNPHRLIRHPYGKSHFYCAQVDAAFAAWDRLWESLGQMFYVPTGTLALSRTAGDWTEQSRQTLNDLGIAHDVLAAEALPDFHPALETTGIRFALHLERGGVLLSDRIAHALVAHLHQHGADLRPHSRVQQLEPALVLEDGAVISADRVVVAVGAYVNRLFPKLQMGINRKINLYLQPPASLSKAWATAPIVVDLGGEMVGVLIPPVAGTALRYGAGATDIPTAAGTQTTVSSFESGQMMSLLQNKLLHLEQYRLTGYLTCDHAVSSNDDFLLEQVNHRTWLVSGCSGHMYKFAPQIGLGLAAKILDNNANFVFQRREKVSV